MNKLHEYFGNWDYEEVDRSLENKLSKLCIGPERRQELLNMPCKSYEILFGIDEKKLKSLLERISLDELKGWNRTDGIDNSNWLECLEGLHKWINFERYKNKDQFEAFLNQIAVYGELGVPEVIEHENEYYVSGKWKT